MCWQIQTWTASLSQSVKKMWSNHDRVSLTVTQGERGYRTSAKMDQICIFIWVTPSPHVSHVRCSLWYLGPHVAQKTHAITPVCLSSWLLGLVWPAGTKTENTRAKRADLSRDEVGQHPSCTVHNSRTQSHHQALVRCVIIDLLIDGPVLGDLLMRWFELILLPQTSADEALLFPFVLYYSTSISSPAVLHSLTVFSCRSGWLTPISRWILIPMLSCHLRLWFWVTAVYVASLLEVRQNAAIPE